ncbi:MAG TPA: type II toxin-antitoxin system RelE/ParE family toxin [Candidatus Hydrogenedentes bacterium]|nr:type II toxin-antitoxin system RelE/ParE family toxin [Candidatus Hydrogenedentota bacterium]
MADYSIVFARSAARELEALHGTLATRILAKIEALALTPQPTACRKLVGTPDLWRIRVGDYRVIYEINDNRQLIDIIAIRHRKDAYR